MKLVTKHATHENFLNHTTKEPNDVPSEVYEALYKVNGALKRAYSGKYIYQDICYFRDQGKLSPIQAFKLMDYLENSNDPTALLEKLKRLRQTSSGG